MAGCGSALPARRSGQSLGGVKIKGTTRKARSRKFAAGERLRGLVALRTRWQSFDREQLRGYLHQLVILEHRAHPTHSYSIRGVPRFHLRLRRKAVARAYAAKGGGLSRALIVGSFPSARRWPGVVALIETKGFPVYENAA